MNKLDLVNQIFGRLTVHSVETTLESGRNRVYCFCSCSCGKFCKVRVDSLKSGLTNSCGCLALETLIKNAPLANYKHGLSRTKGYGNIKKAKREKSIKERTPKWLTDWDKKIIQEFYLYCPEGFDVDHIIPLKGKLVSGLHVPENLQYSYREVHKHKSNKFNPIWT